MNSGKIVLNNFLWRLAERCGAQVVSFVISILLARLLLPETYGEIALVLVFTTLLDVFVDGGFGSALIQKKEADDIDFSSVFYFNVVISFVLYCGIYAFAPAIARFYENTHLVPVVRVMGISLLISAVKNVQQAYVSRNMMFKRFFFATFGGTVCSAIVGILMAYGGCGVWALVAQNLMNQLIDTLVLWFTVRWRPKRVFSVLRLKEMFSFGWKILASNLLNTIYGKIRELLIGKVYCASDLAYFNKGDSFPQTIVTSINSSIGSVMFPAMSAEQNHKERVKIMTRRAIGTSTLCMMPMMMGLAVCAKPIVEVLLTEKWLPCVPYLRIFCFTYAFYPIHTTNLNVIKAMGRSDLFLKLEIIKSVIGICVVAVAIRYGVLAVAYSIIITSVLNQIINTYPNKRLINYGYLEQLRDIMPQLLLSCVMGGAAYCVSFLRLSPWMDLLLRITVGIIVYLTGILTIKTETFSFSVRIVRELFGRIRKNAD